MSYFIMRTVHGNWFVWVTQMNHIPMEIDFDRQEAWVPMQLHGTCNVRSTPFNDWFSGHLNFQIEHHLFPTMPRHNLYKIAPQAKSLCEKHNIPYIVKPSLLAAWRDILGSLKTSGDVWQAHYDAYHHR